jgi:hypothetical protein
MAHASLDEPAGPSSSTAAADDAAGGVARKEKVERDLAGLVEEAAADMPRHGRGAGAGRAGGHGLRMRRGFPYRRSAEVLQRLPRARQAKQGNDGSDRQEAIAKRRSVSACP